MRNEDAHAHAHADAHVDVDVNVGVMRMGRIDETNWLNADFVFVSVRVYDSG